MLKQLSIENFTVFSKANFEFSSGLNVIVGENGTGKSHVLKLVYSILNENGTQGKLKTDFEDAEGKLGLLYSEKIVNVFKPDALSSLVRYQDRPPEGKRIKLMQLDNFPLCVTLSFQDPVYDCAVKLAPNLRGVFKDSLSIQKMPKKWETHSAVFMPTRELLTIYPGFVSLYEGRYLEFEETYRDTALLLGEPLLKTPPADLINILEQAMDGKVRLDNGRFYLETPEQSRIEIPLVAEGLRKLAMLTQLIAVGALRKGTYLFWDEPEANLNPRLVKVIAKVIIQLIQQGIQIFIATHSYFLLKELDILAKKEGNNVPASYFSLLKEEHGVTVETGNSLDELQTIVALEEELAQFDREQEAYN